jgi:hypothetical protein
MKEFVNKLQCTEELKLCQHTNDTAAYIAKARLSI